MKFETTVQIWEEIDKATQGNEMLGRLRTSLVDSAVRYARIRTDWQIANLDERTSMEDQRKRAHNAFIDECNILARAIVKGGGTAAWRQTLGQDRKIIRFRLLLALRPRYPRALRRPKPSMHGCGFGPQKSQCLQRENRLPILLAEVTVTDHSFGCVP